MLRYVPIQLNCTNLYYAVIEQAATLPGKGLMLAERQRNPCSIAAGCMIRSMAHHDGR
jgi:hypothetical protein